MLGDGKSLASLRSHGKGVAGLLKGVLMERRAAVDVLRQRVNTYCIFIEYVRN